MNDPKTTKQLHDVPDERLDMLTDAELIRLVEDLRQQNGLLWTSMRDIINLPPKIEIEVPQMFVRGYNRALDDVNGIITKMLAGGE